MTSIQQEWNRMGQNEKRNTEKIVLSPAQEAWLRKHFKHTKNDDIAAKFGWSQTTLHRFARQMGLTKTPQFQSKCQRNAADKAKASHLRNGTYPPKGYIIPKSQEHRFKPGHKETEAAKRRRVAKAVETMRQIRKEEKARANWGLRQLTKLRVIAQPRRAATQRHYLRKRGYIIQRGSMIAYYDERTDRCPKMEARKMGDKNFIAFTFRPLETTEDRRVTET